MRGHMELKLPAISGQPPRELRDIPISLLVCCRVPRNHRNVQKTRPDPWGQIDPKNRSKMNPKLCPGGAWGTSGAFLGPPGSRSGPIFRHNWKFMKNMKASGRLPDVSGGPWGPRGTPRIDWKSTRWWKNAFQTWILCRFLCTKPLFVVFLRFGVDFSRKIEEKLKKNYIYFFIAALVFLNMATLTKHRILRYESYFLCFSCFDIFPWKTPKKWLQNSKTNSCPRNHQRLSCRDPFGLKNTHEFIRERSKILKIDGMAGIYAWSSERKLPAEVLREEAPGNAPQEPPRGGFIFGRLRGLFL